MPVQPNLLVGAVYNNPLSCMYLYYSIWGRINWQYCQLIRNVHTHTHTSSSTHRQRTHMYIDAYTTITQYRGCRLAVTWTWDQLYLLLHIHWLGFTHSQQEDRFTWMLDIGQMVGQYSSHWGMVCVCVNEQWQTSSGQEANEVMWDVTPDVISAPGKN